MSVNDKIHALIPVFGWSWWQIFLLTLVADWGIFHLIKWLDPPHKKSPYWMMNMYGDIFLPIGIASSVVVIRVFDNPNAWYASRWWGWTVLAAGVAAIIILEFLMEFKLRGKKNRDQVTSPSIIWHTIIFVPMFYLSVISIIPLFATRSPLWAFILALIGFGGWLVTWAHDMKWHPADRHKKTPRELIKRA